jgi:hypothetical protein
MKKIYIVFTLFCAFITFTLVEFSLVGLYLSSPFLKNNVVRSIVQPYYFNFGRRLDQFYCGEYDQNLFYKYKKGVCNLSNLEFETKLEANSFGVRDTQEKLMEVQDVAFIGDSHTSGWGVKNKNRFSDIVLRELNMKGINLGISSYGTVRELKILSEFEKLQGTVKYVVIQYEGNDINENKQYRDNGNLLKISNRQKYLKAQEWNIKKSTYHFGRGWIYSFRKFKETIKINIRDLFGIELGEIPLFMSKKSMLEQIKNNSVDKHVGYFFNVLKNHKSLLKGREIIIFGINSSPDWSDKLQQALELNDLGLNITIFNAQEILGEEDHFYIDHHINTEGHKKIASKIIRVFKKVK